MNESKNNAKLIANLIQTEKESHCLFRAYGITAIDSNRPPRRSDIAVQCARYYPDVTVGRVKLDSVDVNGHVTISVDLK